MTCPHLNLGLLKVKGYDNKVSVCHDCKKSIRRILESEELDDDTEQYLRRWVIFPPNPLVEKVVQIQPYDLWDPKHVDKIIARRRK